MDYQFFYNERQIPDARFSMDHEALGLWFSDELGADCQKIAEISRVIKAIIAGEQTNYSWQGRDFLLLLTREEAEVIDLSLLNEASLAEIAEQDLDYYDAEQRAMCGLEDFYDLLIDWRDFLEL